MSTNHEVEVTINDSNVPTIGSSQITTGVTYKWEIENWLEHQCKHETGKKLASPLFPMLNDFWCLHVYPNGINKDSQEYVSLILCRFSKNKMPIDVEFNSVSLRISDKVACSSDIKIKATFDSKTYYQGPFKLLAKAATITEHLRTSSVDKITISLQMLVKEKGLCDTRPDMTQHSNALEKFVNNEHLSDVKFMVEGKEIFAHKMVLSAHSPVFAAMFEHEMREKVENVVEIEDISYKAFLELLHFVYTGEYFFTDKSPVSELFKATDKYQLLVLKKACEQQLLTTINICNVVDYLNLADMYDVGALKKGALDYIVDHGKEMIGKPEMEALKNLNTSLFNEVLGSIFARLN